MDDVIAALAFVLLWFGGLLLVVAWAWAITTAFMQGGDIITRFRRKILRRCGG